MSSREYTLRVIGETLAGRYRLDEEVGEGGFGVVYRAFDVRTGATVAVKLLKAVDPATVARFQREVEITRRLRSPHVAALLDSGTTSGQPFAVFEFVLGRDLADVLADRQQLPPAVVTRILIAVLEALRESHRLGLLHRDIKPQNIRVRAENSSQPDVRLLDFGIARSTDDSHPGVTKTGELIGSPRYMSPEQLRAEALTPASDIYSLGLVGLEMLFGPDILGGNRVSDQLQRIISGITLPRASRDATEQTLVEQLVKMTSVDSTARTQSAANVLRALDATRERGVVELSTEDATTRRPLMLAAVMAVCAVVAGFVIVSVLRTPNAVAPQRRLVVEKTSEVREPVAIHESAADSTVQDADTPDAPEPHQLAAYGTSGCSADDVPFERGPLDYVRRPLDYQSQRLHPLIVLLQDKWDNWSSFRNLQNKTAGIERFLDESGVGLLADDGGYVVVALGVKDVVHDGGRGDARDIPTIERLLARVGRALCLDRRRVYVIANGYGGHVGHLLACKPWVTAVTLNSFLFEPKHLSGEDRWQACPSSARPVMLLTPRNSARLPADGSPPCDGDEPLPSVEVAEEMWRSQNRCDSDRARSYFEDDQGRCHTWECATNFVSCQFDGGYMWPGMQISKVGKYSMMAAPPRCKSEPVSGFPASMLALRFFDTVALDEVPPGPWDADAE